VLARLDQFEYHQVLAATPGTALVCFTAPRCGACRAMRQALAALATQRPELHLFEIDGQQDAALTRELEVFHFPSLFLYRDGEYHAPLHSEPLPGRLALAIDAGLAAPAQDPP
jgi:thioredoxin 1